MSSPAYDPSGIDKDGDWNCNSEEMKDPKPQKQFSCIDTGTTETAPMYVGGGRMERISAAKRRLIPFQYILFAPVRMILTAAFPLLDKRNDVPLNSLSDGF